MDIYQGLKKDCALLHCKFTTHKVKTRVCNFTLQFTPHKVKKRGNTKKNTTYDVGNPGPGLGQAQKCGWVKPVNGIPSLSSWLLIEIFILFILF
jgi:hypothetical protein